jgi:hypothetical protein
MSVQTEESRERKKLRLDMTTMELVTTMAEGNPGAISVMVQIIQNESGNGLLDLLNFDDMNMRGPQIWVAYKDVCGQNIDLLLEKLKSRDTEMVSKVNDVMGASIGAYPHKAVLYGGAPGY